MVGEHLLRRQPSHSTFAATPSSESRKLLVASRTLMDRGDDLGKESCFCGRAKTQSLRWARGMLGPTPSGTAGVCVAAEQLETTRRMTLRQMSKLTRTAAPKVYKMINTSPVRRNNQRTATYWIRALRRRTEAPGQPMRRMSSSACCATKLRSRGPPAHGSRHTHTTQSNR